eukprot:TRINITY_DN68015_c0_g1_i1.p1 TRINITY_DN68015_c0_g1~~TRINITY_DN68015_c0_g1_i1.p1  ORF type:complete len:183 (+),score=44.93 TRINITY_DN68015_c0_g1_i1:685-1233(+)
MKDFRMLLSKMAAAPEISEMWTPQQQNRHHLLMLRFQPDVEHDAVKLMWRAKLWYRDFQDKPKATGSDKLIWVVPNQPTAKRNMSSAVSKGLRLLHVIRENRAVPANFEQHGFQSKTIAGGYVKGEVMFMGKTVGTYSETSSAVDWDYVALRNSELKVSEEEFKILSQFELQSPSVKINREA